MKQTAVEWLHSEYKRILGDVLVKPSQGIEIADAFDKAKEMEKEQETTYTEEELLRFSEWLGFEVEHYNYPTEENIIKAFKEIRRILKQL